ncbi:nitrous oxide-stimulated promoter family protein [Paenibacillus sp. CAA11]|nr:nitrous oxide-stimulated promoter family protein [Paenibacillus sp. CAA11]
MIVIYCKAHHGNDRQEEARAITTIGTRQAALCPDCMKLLDYANQRLTLCRFGEKKTTCVNCSIHCYQPLMKEQIRKVMRYAGPRMLSRHPVLAIRHLWDGAKKTSH